MVKLDHENREAYTQAVINALQAEEKQAFREYFLELHPTDQTDIFNALDAQDRQKLYHYLEATEFAQVFQGLELGEQKDIVEELEQSYAADMFNYMYADDVAAIFGQLDTEQKDQFLEKMDPEYQEDIADLLAYPEHSAGSIMTTEFISVSTKNTVSEVMAILKKEAPDAETIYYLYVVDEQEKLVGVVSLRDLIVASDHATVDHIMSSRVVSITVTDDQEEVAAVIKKYDFLAVPVISTEGKLAGIITVDDVLDVVEEEATEDIGEIAAVRGSTDINLSSFAAARKRSPWIILLMFLGLVAAGIIEQFEETLNTIVILAAFIPLIMGSAGNTGTQSLAVVVRSLALGTIERNGIFRLLKRELGTGLMLGLICAVVIFLIITIVPYLQGPPILGVIVGVSIFCTLSVATVIGATVPLIINKLKIDPAIASGPFITTINDILGLLIYFTVATTLLNI